MAVNLMYNPNVNAQNYPFCRLWLVVETFDTQFNKPTNIDLLKVPKVVKLMNKKRYWKALGTNVIKAQYWEKKCL